MTVESLLGFKINLFVCRQLKKCYTWGFSVLKSNTGFDWLSVKWTHYLCIYNIYYLCICVQRAYIQERWSVSICRQLMFKLCGQCCFFLPVMDWWSRKGVCGNMTHFRSLPLNELWQWTKFNCLWNSPNSLAKTWLIGLITHYSAASPNQKPFFTACSRWQLFWN